jgi:hypothetical protein
MPAESGLGSAGLSFRGILLLISLSDDFIYTIDCLFNQQKFYLPKKDCIVESV